MLAVLFVGGHSYHQRLQTKHHMSKSLNSAPLNEPTRFVAIIGSTRVFISGHLLLTLGVCV